MVWTENSTFLEGFLLVLLRSASLKGHQALAVPSSPFPSGSTAVTGTVTLNLCPALTWVNPAMLRAFPSPGYVSSLITS